MLKPLLFGALMFSLTASAFAKDDLPLEKLVYTDAGAKKLPYRLLKTAIVEAGKTYPLVIFLHGAGERGTDNDKQLVHGIPQFAARREKFPCFLIVPQCPADQKWVEVDWAAATHSQPKEMGDAGRMVLELIDKSMKDLPIDAKRVYLTGLSMGGYGTWDLLARRPELFAAGAPVCGGADESTAEKIKHIPLWIFHGAKDGVVKPERSRNMVSALKQAGGRYRYSEYAAVGHDSWNNAYSDPDFYEWLFAQHR